MPTTRVLDSTIFYREVGTGPIPLVFLHGNPTSSYLWRHILPVAGASAWCLAPDLIGMGESGKPDIDYSFDDHARYLDAWLDALALDRVVLVGHDWGGALAFDWAARHPGRVAGIAFTETIVKSMAWDEFPAGARPLFEAMRTPEVGEAMILDENALIEQALPRTVPGLSEEDLAVYGRPYPTRRSRMPLLQWPRSMPLDGEPAAVVARIDAYGRWLADSPDVPKLLIAFEPGESTMMNEQIIDWCAAHMSALRIETHGTAGHHTPEDRPEAIAESLVAWLDGHGLLSGGEG
ncbi:haloalkane dehalogenase [Actinomadura bangladeshensis]|uniref:Haloalkane dehalogenase n=1 Tax=Actinomadura bangladeshensis TaxID=453573 RepID=A0A6L9QME6_9ACTN|nr:haloalkane dehalogenase [Actinomadura bangladeshensis]